MVSAEDLQRKFEQDGAFTLVFGSAAEYHAGLAGLVGLAEADLEVGMRCDHTEHVDADAILFASNYETRTSSRLEYWYVVDPSAERLRALLESPSAPLIAPTATTDAPHWPRDKFAHSLTEAARSRQPRPPSAFAEAWGDLDVRL
eukprot:6619695-Prymnesium_polylepis.1